MINNNNWNYDTPVDEEVYNKTATQAKAVQRDQMEAKHTRKNENFQVYCGV